MSDTPRTNVDMDAQKLLAHFKSGGMCDCYPEDWWRIILLAMELRASLLADRPDVAELVRELEECKAKLSYVIAAPDCAPGRSTGPKQT